MSLGNDPRNTPPREEPEPEECRHCDRRTYDPSQVCPDCWREMRAPDVPGAPLTAERPDTGSVIYCLDDECSHCVEEADLDEHR